MGYEMNIRLTVHPAERFDEVAKAIEDDPSMGYQFNENEGWEDSGMTRWSNMTEDMIELSNQFPGVLIQMLTHGEDDAMCSEWFKDGKTYCDSRPEWKEPPFDESKLQLPT